MQWLYKPGKVRAEYSQSFSDEDCADKSNGVPKMAHTEVEPKEMAARRNAANITSAIVCHGAKKAEKIVKA